MEAGQNNVQAKVFEDPVFSGTTRVRSENVDAVCRAGFSLTMCRQADDKMEHWYEGVPGVQAMHSSGLGKGLWWPVWLVTRTKGGWWTICWYQLMDGGRVVDFWWYADVHVHLLDSVR